MAVKRRRLTDANIAKLAPAAREYTVWDTRLAVSVCASVRRATAASFTGGRAKTARAGLPSGLRH